MDDDPVAEVRGRSLDLPASQVPRDGRAQRRRVRAHRPRDRGRDGTEDLEHERVLVAGEEEGVLVLEIGVGAVASASDKGIELAHTGAGLFLGPVKDVGPYQAPRIEAPAHAAPPGPPPPTPPPAFFFFFFPYLS